MFRQSQAGLVSQFGDAARTDGPGGAAANRGDAVRGRQERIADRQQRDSPIARTVTRRRRPQVPRGVEHDAQRDDQSGLRPGGVRSGVLNLTAYESFFDERRPFFVAGSGLFRFDVNCSQVNCSNEGLYYSRRIGRTPELAGTYGDTVPQQPTTILGAAKLLGPVSGRADVGVLDATTRARRRSRAIRRRSRATNFAVARVTQDLRNGNSAIGAMLTAVNRGIDRWSSPYLASSAYAAALDFRHRFLDEQLRDSGSLDQSRVQGSRGRDARIQTDAVHYYQRPDGRCRSTRTARSLGGDAEEFKFDKVGGQHLMFETAYQRRSAGFEINDMGYLRRADQQSWNTWVGSSTGASARSTTASSGTTTGGSTGRRPGCRWRPRTTRTCTSRAEQLVVEHGRHDRPARHDVRRPRARAAGRRCGRTRTSRRGLDLAAMTGALVPYAEISTISAATPGAIRRGASSPEIDYKMLGAVQLGVRVGWSHNISDNQWYGNYTDAAGRPALHVRASRPDTTSADGAAQLHVHAHRIAAGVHAAVRVQGPVHRRAPALVDAARRRLRRSVRAVRRPSVTDDPGGFNFKEFQSNLVFRWEYRPGSTLFVVWNEGRQGYVPAEGNAELRGRRARAVAAAPGEHVPREDVVLAEPVTE